MDETDRIHSNANRVAVLAIVCASIVGVIENDSLPQLIFSFRYASENLVTVASIIVGSLTLSAVTWWQLSADRKQRLEKERETALFNATLLQLNYFRIADTVNLTHNLLNEPMDIILAGRLLDRVSIAEIQGISNPAFLQGLPPEVMINASKIDRLQKAQNNAFRAIENTVITKGVGPSSGISECVRHAQNQNIELQKFIAKHEEELQKAFPEHLTKNEIGPKFGNLRQQLNKKTSFEGELEQRDTA